MKRENRQQITEQFGVKSLYLFGSIARDEGEYDSDIDLLVEFDQPIGLFRFIELQQKLETILGAEVDLGTRRSLKIEFTDRITGEAISVI